MKKSTLTILLTVIVCTAFGQPNTVLPNYMADIPAGEYVGVSLPGGGQRQAVDAALLAYFIGTDSDAGMSNSYTSTSSRRMDGTIDYENSKSDIIITYMGTLSYDIAATTLLPTGETVVRIRSGNQYSENVSLILSSESYSETIDVASTFHLDYTLKLQTGHSTWETLFVIDDKNERLVLSSDYTDTTDGTQMHYSPGNDIYQYSIRNSPNLKGYRNGLKESVCEPGWHLSAIIIFTLCNILTQDLEFYYDPSDEKFNRYNLRIYRKRAATPITGIVPRKEHLLLLYNNSDR